MCQEHFFRCITCNNYDPGLNTCIMHRISVLPELNLCSSHSSQVYVHMDENVLFEVEETLLGSELKKSKKIKSVTKIMNFLCKKCRTKISRLIETDSEFLNEILKFFRESSRKIEEDLYSSSFVENQDYDKYLVEDSEFDCEIEKFSLCNNCIPKIRRLENSESDPLLTRIVKYFELFLKNEF